MRRDLVYRDEIMDSLVKEYNRKRTNDGLKLAWIEKAVNDVEPAQIDLPDNNVGDMISRSSLLAKYDEEHEGPPGRARKLIEEEPPAWPKWIPVTERLPGIGEPVLDDCFSLNWMSYRSGGKEWVFPRDVRAWMPLPEAYKKNSEGATE